MKNDDIYFSLDEARVELARRWDNRELRVAVETELGKWFNPAFGEKPRGVITRQILSPDNGFIFFHHLSNYVGGCPFSWEFHGDYFARCNKEKKGWGELHTAEEGLVKIISMTASNQKPLKDVVTLMGEPLVNFHRRLLNLSGYPIEQKDMTAWFRGIGKPVEYYYYWLLHFVAHGVLFENFQTDSDPKEALFTSGVVLPNMRNIEAKLGLRPLVVRLYPENQSDEEDFYWWCYPPRLNEYIVKYALDNNIPMQKLK